MVTRVIQVPPGQAAEPAAEQAARVLKDGGLVGFPTETVYGLAALAAHGGAMERLRELKSRPARPFSVHLARPQELSRYVRSAPEDARRLVAKGWPGPVTVLLPAGGRLADEGLQAAGLYGVLCHEDLIGLRCPDHPAARAMLAAAGGPVVAPSANLTGRPAPRTARQVLADLDGRIELLLDAGPTRYGADSTIVAFGPGSWRIARKGVYDAAAIRRLIRRVWLFLCTGNTCRSPMAAGLARKRLAERLGCRVGELASRGYEVLSAGLLTGEGGRASPQAVRAARRLGADISRHRAGKLTRDWIRQADLVFCMTEAQVADVRRLAGEAADRVVRLDPAGDVSDPVGLDQSDYDQTARRIDRAVADIVETRSS